MSDRASQTSPMASAMAAERIMVDDPVVACDGGGGPLGHPRVFLRIVGRQAVCPYCSRTYVLKEGAGHGHAH